MTNRINNQSIIPSTDVIQLTLTLKMTTAQVVETSVTVNSNGWFIQDYVHPDDQTQPTFEMTCRFKNFNKMLILIKIMLRSPFAIGPVSVTSFESASVLIMASLPKIVKCRPDQRLKTFFNIQAFRQSWFCHQRLFRKRTLTPKVETYCFGQEMPKGSSFPNLLFHDPSHSPSVFVLFIFNPEKEPSFSSRENKDIAEESSRVKVVV